MSRKKKGATSIFFLKQAIGSMTSILLIILLFGIGPSGCSSSGSDEIGISNNNGELVIGLTDAESNFAAYDVDVVSLTLTKQNGAVVDTLPVMTRVDFAQYVEMTEFLTAATIPAGRYVKATIELDYTHANIQVQRPDGTAVRVDTDNIRDEFGSTITRLTTTVHLQGRNALTIAPGIPVHLTLDFDLSASNHVDLTDTDSPVLIVKPTLMADVNAENPKIHRLRGPLKEINPADGTFSLIIRPFIHVISGGDDRFGTLKVVTNASTFYDINGEMYQGEAGLAEMELQQVLTAVVVIGDLNIATRQFEASQVYAGSSVPGGTLDVITGNVIRRSGNQLTVRGATLIRASGSVVFNDEVNILLDQLERDTTVSRQLSTDLYDSQDISVGQRIMVFGELSDDEKQLNAAHVRMLLTTIKGNLVFAESGTVSVDLTAIDSRNIDLFDFTGTGAISDANPAEYVVDVAGLNTDGLDTATPLKIRGFVTPFDHAADVADFEARTLIDVSKTKGLMIATWNPASPDAISNITESNFTLNLDGIGLFHHLNRAGVVVDLAEMDDPPIISTQNDIKGVFQIVQGESRQIFFTFDGFAAELAQRLDAGSEVTSIISRGLFDDAIAIFSADLVIVALK
ncbi:MAG: hypothetical protein PVI69_15190 [Desulfobacterales bacterium]|jgi:hypothetical protein